MAVPTKYYETDLVTTEDVFDVVSLADYLILESIYKLEFYCYTLQLKELTNEMIPTLEVNKEVERIIEKITKTESYNAVFANLYNFVRQDFDDNYQQFLMELLTGRYAMLQLNNIINMNSFGDDVEGNVVAGKLKDPEGRRYFHMVFAHIKSLEIRNKMEKEKNQGMKAMMDAIKKPFKFDGGESTVKPFSVDIFSMSPPSPEDQKIVHEMFKKMMEESMKYRGNQIKKDLEYGELKKNKNKSIFEENDIDDFLDENDEYDTFEMDEEENDGR